jgi:signal transduction histidine kinase
MTTRSTGEQRLRAALAAALDAERGSVAERWMDEIAPADRLIDHAPALIAEIARHLVAPEAETLVANTQVFAKAAELGSLRFEQRATIHQILREYEPVADLLSQFVLEHIGSTNVRCTPVDALRAVDSVRAAVRLLQRQTIDQFLSRQTELARAQSARLRDVHLLMSHEIRQPLGVLAITAQLIQGPDAHVSQFAATIDRNVRELARAVARLDRVAGLGESDVLTEQTVDLESLLHDVVEQIKPTAVARQVRVEIRGPLPVLVAEPGRIELVFTNLLVNAIEYSDPNKPDRVVVVRPSLTGDGRVGVAVEDNGIGLSPDCLPTIFNHDYRVGESNGAGSGLGLAIVRDCMAAMEGAVQADSRVGEGTTFLLTWPASRLAQSTAGAPRSGPKTTGEALYDGEAETAPARR